MNTLYNMRSLAVAMIIMGSIFSITAIVFLFRGASITSGIAILIPSLFLVVSGVITLSHIRDK